MSFAKDLVAGFDVPAEPAEEMVRHVDGPMKDSILKLYRSALMVGAEWEPALANVSASALVFWGALDPARQRLRPRCAHSVQRRAHYLPCHRGAVQLRPDIGKTLGGQRLAPRLFGPTHGCVDGTRVGRRW